MTVNSIINEKDLLYRISKGDQRAFTLLFDVYYQQLGSYILKLTQSNEITEEIVQEVFIKIWEKRDSLENVDNIKAYLFVLSKNKTLDYLRKSVRKRAHQLSLLKDFKEDTYEIDSLCLIEEYSLIIEDTITKLPPQQQKVYQLSRHEKLKYEDIAMEMGISKETVKKHMKLATLFLKQNVKIQIENLVLGFLIVSYFQYF